LPYLLRVRETILLFITFYLFFQLCISPAVSDIQETENTLHFGQRLQKVATKPIVNTEVNIVFYFSNYPI